MNKGQEAKHERRCTPRWSRPTCNIHLVDNQIALEDYCLIAVKVSKIIRNYKERSGVSWRLTRKEQQKRGERLGKIALEKLKSFVPKKFFDPYELMMWRDKETANEPNNCKSNEKKTKNELPNIQHEASKNP